MRLSITARLALLGFGLILAANLVLVGLVWSRLHDNAIGTLRRDTGEQAESYTALLRTGGRSAFARTVDDAYARGDETLIAMLTDGNGRRLAGRGPDAAVLAPIEASEFRVVTLGSSAPWLRHQAGVTIRAVGRDWLIAGRLLDDWEQEQRTIEQALLAAALVSLLLGVAGALVLTRYVGARLDRIGGVVGAVAAGDISRRVELVAAGDDAFDRLAAQLNRMLDKIERLMGELRVMSDSLAHDLRSPIARLRAKAETAALQADPEARDAALGGLIAETDLVMRMLGTLLDIGRSESITRDRFVSVDPGALVEEIADFYAPVAEEAGVTLTAEIAAGLPRVDLHRELMAQAIINLVENALNHAGDGRAIKLSAGSVDRYVRIAVADRGPGIPADQHEAARRRFGRLDGARTTPGAGLGLALVDAVARLHGGRLVLADNAPGLIASIDIPVAGADRAASV